MLEIDQDPQRLAHDVVRAASLDVDDEADAAGVVLGARIVETLIRRRASVGRAGRTWSDSLYDPPTHKGNTMFLDIQSLL